ncbi:uncharacterized acetyltransferase At3g50280-like [Oryza sativa Japonica Group]|uniref:uncharacterized acetyltransferase At3g50280-like n=1 Tax=Oryza sativa subsp. japonica TaxID=39947 RepID=UPI0007755962
MGSNDHRNVALAVDRVRVLSRRLVRPSSSSSSSGHAPPRDIHLTPWDLRFLSIDYIQKGVLLPKPPLSGDRLADALASSFARALALFYPFAGRLVAEERADDGTVTVALRCTGEGAEFVHAAAPGVAVSDVVSSLYTPPEVWSFYSYNLVLGADAATESRPVLSVQVTELADGVFVGMSLNHSVGDGTTFWKFMNAWSEINRRAGGAMSDDLMHRSMGPKETNIATKFEILMSTMQFESNAFLLENLMSTMQFQGMEEILWIEIQH